VLVVVAVVVLVTAVGEGEVKSGIGILFHVGWLPSTRGRDVEVVCVVSVCPPVVAEVSWLLLLVELLFLTV